jgi:hypothetical protein
MSPSSSAPATFSLVRPGSSAFAGQSDLSSIPLRKKPRRVSDQIDCEDANDDPLSTSTTASFEAVKDASQDPLSTSTTSTTSVKAVAVLPTPAERVTHQQNPLSLLCFALETHFDKENASPLDNNNNHHNNMMMMATMVSPQYGAVSTHKKKKKQQQQQQPTSASTLKRAYQPWQARYEELLSYKASHGNCRVPQKSKDSPALARWVVYMRAQYKAGKLSHDKIHKLEEAGFDWNASGSRVDWDERFKELKQYKLDHGHMNVLPQENAALNYWCYMQRRKKNELALEYLMKLESIGFDWSVYYDTSLSFSPDSESNEHDKFVNELQIHYRMHGHADVAEDYETSPELAKWAHHVTVESLEPKHVALMNSLGFVWKQGGISACDAGTMTDFTFLRTLSVSRFTQ